VEDYAVNIDPALILNGTASQGLLITPIQNQSFTVEVGTFVAFAKAPQSSFTATISWGDDSFSEGVITEIQPDVFRVVGTHTYTTESTSLVSFTVSQAEGASATADAGAAVVLTTPQNNELMGSGFQFLGPGGGTATATTSDVQATLTQPDGSSGSATLFVARFDGLPAGDQNTFTAQGRDLAGVYDVRATGVGRNGQLKVVFRFTQDGTPTLFFFDVESQSFLPVSGSKFAPNSQVIDLAARTITVVFDSSSFPTIFGLGGTVFTISVPTASATASTASTTAVATGTATTTTTTTTTTTITPATSLAFTQSTGTTSGATTDSSSGFGVSVTFQRNSERTISLNASLKSSQTTSGSAGSETEEDDKKDEKKKDGMEQAAPGDTEKPPEKPEDEKPEAKEEGEAGDREEGMQTETLRKSRLGVVDSYFALAASTALTTAALLSRRQRRSARVRETAFALSLR
jgi:hypothetical protein